MAVIVHGGIVVALGMPTFGLVMLIGNLAFVSPQNGPQGVRPASPGGSRWPSSARRQGQGASD